MIEVIKAEDIPNLGDYDIDIYNAIIVPKGATNGDMIKAMFSDMRDEIWNALYDADLCGKNSWWNAPYKRGNEDEDN